MKVSQYADDTTLCIEDINSPNYAVKYFKWLEKDSGLAINNDKTKGVKMLGPQEAEAYLGRASTVLNGRTLLKSCTF